MATGIPVLDFAHLTDARRRDRFIQALGEGLEEFGFVALENHGVAPELLDRAYRTARATFALPEAVKGRYETPEDGRQRGYTRFGVEHARNRHQPDLKEFWHVGREASAEVDLPRNRFPSEVPEFAPVFGELFGVLDHLSVELLECIGAYLSLEAGTFRHLTRDGNSVLRIIHYPPLPADLPPGGIRAAEHEDINLITVLPVSTEPGLELLTRDGRWLSVSPPPGVMVCDTGDMMQLLTGGRIPATTHRVVNPTVDLDKPRYSMPFFCHPHPDRLLAPIAGDAAPVLARDFLHRRLVEIGVA